MRSVTSAAGADAGPQGAGHAGDARRLEEEDEDELWRLVQAGFRERRKMIHNVLARQLSGLDRGRVDAGLSTCGIAPDRRPQTLTVDEWLALREALSPLP